MSVGYRAVSWTPSKKRYDAVLAAGVALYLLGFVGVGLALHATATIETLLIRAFGTAAFLLLHVALSIGPLSRLSPRFLPLLYNRRHLGVTTFLLGLAHGVLATVHFHAGGDLSPLVSLLGGDPGFQTFGVAALAVLFVMAATSHDFWLAHLTAPVWKGIHMAVYGAYALLVVHVGWGALRSESAPLLAIATGGGLVFLVGIHLAAARRESAADVESPARDEGWIDAGPAETIPDGRARIVTASGERIAVFRNGETLSAISNVCRHQNGPLGEGRIVDGCVTCPWHGYQYRPEDGRSPAPFTETVPTFAVRVVAGRVLVDPRPYPSGTALPPARIDGAGQGDAAPGDDPFYIGYLPAPPAIARFARRAAIVLVVGAGGLGALLAAATGPFGPGLFEYATERGFEGTIVESPYPILVLDPGPGERPRAVPLVATWKRGAGPLVAGLDGKRVALRGKRILHEEDLMIEIAPGSVAILEEGTREPEVADLGRATLTGEIVDSKCFYGVMNPGRLAVHRACAIRCISGGIPPVLFVRGPAGERGIVFLVSAAGEPVNREVLPLVARPVTIAGRLERRDGRLTLYADPSTYRLRDLTSAPTGPEGAPADR